MNAAQLLSTLLAEVYTDELKAAGWKRQGSSFRSVGSDGLGKIINFQRSRWSTKEYIEFYINYGLYIEAGDALTNRSFKEYECQFRERTTYARGCYCIASGAALDAVKEQIMPAVAEARGFLDTVQMKEQLVRMLLDGSLQRRTELRVLHYDTCRLLYEMGYGREVYDAVRSTGGMLFDELAREIEENVWGW